MSTSGAWPGGWPARTHGGNEQTWARAVTDARAIHASELSADHEAQRPAAQPE
ncbi:hypothetical protein [Streptomyces sp. NPDC102282]|uniref:hypothetical protein n=1 Tax=Streptomyces sp. NPDC102282 TaxID=3366154 RepID=UPI0037FAF268